MGIPLGNGVLCVKSRFSFGFEALSQTKPQVLPTVEATTILLFVSLKSSGLVGEKSILGRLGRSEDNDSEDEDSQQAVSYGLSWERGKVGDIERQQVTARPNRSPNASRPNR